MLKGLGNIQELMQQAQKMNARMQEVQKSLAGKRETASAGGGMVEVTINGKLTVESIKIDPEVLRDSDLPMLQDLITCAVNEALSKMQRTIQESMSQVTGGLPIPGLGG